MTLRVAAGIGWLPGMQIIYPAQWVRSQSFIVDIRFDRPAATNVTQTPPR